MSEKSLSRTKTSRSKAAETVRSWLLAVLMTLAATSGLMAQSATDNPSRGSKVGNSYSVGDIETINLTNGNLMLNIPLGSLPAGRGGAGGGISLVYNSKLYDIQRHRIVDSRYSQPAFYDKTVVVPASTGGWRYSGGYSIETEDRMASFGSNAPGCSGTPYADFWTVNTFKHKLHVVFPDGSKHEMIPSGYDDYQDDGFYRIKWDGTFENCGGTAANIGTPLTYFSIDGTHMRLEFGAYGNGWTLYFPDGGKATSDSKVYDRNGNYVTATSSSITDQLGRAVSISTVGNDDEITSKGFDGEDVVWTVKWKYIWVRKTYESCPQPQGEIAPCPEEGYRSNLLLGENWMNWRVVDKIIQPTQLGGGEYVFTYNGSSSYPSAETTGWGEISGITLPHDGAQVSYEYKMDGEDGPTSHEFTKDIIRNHVTEKVLTYDLVYDGSSAETSEKWIYDIQDSSGQMTGPDGSTTVEHFASTQAAYTVPPSEPLNPGWDSGLSYLTYNPDGSKTERIWARNRPVVTGSGSDMDPNKQINPYVKTEFTSIQSGSSYTLTAIKDFTYDKNGNVTEVKEYDWMPHSTAHPSGVPTVPSGTTYLKRITKTEYYNPSPEASTTTYNDADSYIFTTSERLLRLAKNVEIQDSSATPKSRSEFDYDYENYDSSNTKAGNVTETKTWDSFKGGSSRSYSNPLTSTNSITTTATYNSYGMPLTATDANGVTATTTYGSISKPGGTVSDLYPTQTETASGTSVERTITMTPDFFTGLVKSTVDTDNSNLTTVYDYDALGRPTQANTASGVSGKESRTLTQYNDAGRYIVVKSDLSTLNDGKLVSVQHFDQLGRVRLSRTLEDASTEDPTDINDGIKVQTRYKYDNPSSPSTSNGTYTLTSNPYRASTSSGASGEATMGWTLAYKDKTGSTSTVTSYTGAGRPSVFGGSNSTTSGTVTTTVDETATTIEDQAGKLRRSITNAFGQVVRVDEPNGSNQLGTISSPNQATNYYYNTLGNMVRVEQGSQNRYFMHNTLGRTIRIFQPEQDVNSSLNTSGNPDNNSWTAGSTYDNNGNLLTTTDAKGTTITSTYDQLNRPLTRSYSDGTPTVTNYYDGNGLGSIPAYSRGKLTRVSSGVSDTRYTAFDAAGRTTSTSQITGIYTYSTSHQYNLAGAPTQITYPDGRTVSTNYDADGDISSITGVPSGGSSKTYANNFTYTADKKIQQLQLGNNLWETAVVNPRLQVTEFQLGTTQGGYDVWRAGYEYGELQTNGTVDATKNAGNIAKQTVNFSGLAYPFGQSYKYDPLDRITEAKETVNGTQTWIQNWGYDRYGNRSSFTQNILGNTAVSNPTINTGTNRYNSSQGYTFDANGNVTTDPANGGRTFVFNGDNKQIEVKDSGNSNIGTYFYDGEGKRVKKQTPTETTVFVYANGQLVEERNASNVVTTSYIYARAQLLATETPSSTNYTVTDQLGSPRVIVNGSGSVVARRDFLPFGEELYADGTYRTTTQAYTITGADAVRQRFTGYQKDSETELDFAQARYYNNRHARFTAVDPLLASGKSSDPQTFNRYTYSQNQPIKLTDPTGLQAGKPSGAWYVPVAPPQDSLWRAQWIENGHEAPQGYRAKSFSEHVFSNAETGRWDAQNPIDGTTASFDDEASARHGLDTWTGGVTGILAQRHWGQADMSESMLGKLTHGITATALTVASQLSADVGPDVMRSAAPSPRTFTIYLGKNAGNQLYVGHTVRDLGVRQAEHISQGGAKATLTLARQGAANSTLEARIAEQSLMNSLGGKGSSRLLNKINAVAPKYWEKFNILPPR